MSHDTDTTDPAAPPLSIYQAIPRIIGELPAIGKDSRMTAPGSPQYAYRGIDDIMPHLKPLLARHGVFIAPVYEVLVDDLGTTQGGKPQRRVVVKGMFRFVAADGSSLAAQTVGEALDTGDKSHNKAMTAALKYAVLQVFAIAGADDPDNHHAELGVDVRPVVGTPGEPFPEGAVMPPGGPWALTADRVLVYAETPNFEALVGLRADLDAAGIADVVRDWAEKEGVALARGHDEPGVARVVEYARKALADAEHAAGDAEAAAQDAAEGPAVPLDPDTADTPEPPADGQVDPVADLRAQLADKGIELPDDAAAAAEQMAETVADRGGAS